MSIASELTSHGHWRFEPLSKEFTADPYAAYANLREEDDLYYFKDFDVWIASRFEDVRALALDKRMVRSLDGIATREALEALQRRNNWHDMPYHERYVQVNLLESDGPVHDRLRRQIFGYFTSSAVNHWQALIQDYVDGLLDSLSGRDEIDFVSELASHVPGHIIGRMLGVPDEDCPKLREWSEEIVRYFDIDRTEEKKRIAENATREFAEYMIALKAEREKNPKDDLISQLLEVERNGGFLEDEFIATVMLILKAGHGSTIDVLGSGMHALLEFPDQMQKLRDDPTLIGTAVQEMFRYESPLPFFHRHNCEEIELKGRRYPKGTKFGLLYASANRDPAVFPNPDSFDITRTPNRHIAFGAGPHFCLGNHLSRLDMEVIFTSLLNRFSSIELLEKPNYKPGLQARGPQSLHLRLREA
ncbi:cytochrome P450 [Hoeflea sp. CAU 1731]